MTIALASGEWHGISVEDLVMAFAGVIFALVFVRVFAGSIAHEHGARRTRHPRDRDK